MTCICLGDVIQDFIWDCIWFLFKFERRRRRSTWKNIDFKPFWCEPPHQLFKDSEFEMCGIWWVYIEVEIGYGCENLVFLLQSIHIEYNPWVFQVIINCELVFLNENEFVDGNFRRHVQFHCTYIDDVDIVHV